jgi:hypothetical protein
MVCFGFVEGILVDDFVPNCRVACYFGSHFVLCSDDGNHHLYYFGVKGD